MGEDELKHVMRSLGVGVAVTRPEDWSVTFENALFFKWFPPIEEPDAPLSARIADFDADKTLKRLERGRPYRQELEIKVGAKTVAIEVSFSQTGIDGEDLIIVECHDVTKRQQAEYMLDSYSRMAEKNSRELQREKERVEKLLLNVMPRSVYEELKDFGTTTPQRFDDASVMMLDFVDFTEMAVVRDPSALIGELNDIFSAFDRITDLFGCERIKTIGDAYLAVSGLPESNADHAVNVAKLAVRIRRYLERRNASHPIEWRCRIGIATGSVVGSIVGIQKYVYDIFGPAVNWASRLEESAEPMQIVINDRTNELIREAFQTAPMGQSAFKGVGTADTFSIIAERAGS